MAPVTTWKSGLFQRLKAWARNLKTETHALVYAIGDDRTPWFPKVFALLVLAYALSPVDLIPDFIPVLGLLDDVILVPLGLVLLRKMIPADVMEDARARVRDSAGAGVSKRWQWIGLALTVCVWLAGLLWMGRMIWVRVH